MPAMIETGGLCKEYRGGRWPWGRVPGWRRERSRSWALRDVALRVEEGEIYALLGPNGAGKTTLLRILATLLLPTAGWARVGGHDVVGEEDRVRELVGLVLGDERSFYWRLSGRQNLSFFGTLQGLGGRRLAVRIGELAELLGLSEGLDRPFGIYSTGARQRLALARGLLHDPPVLLMDEPTRSLDPEAAAAFHATLRRLVREAGKTVLAVTHQLDEARALADRVGVLAEGRLVLESPDPARLADYFEVPGAGAWQEAR